MNCDSSEYNILTEAVGLVKNVNGLTCEIGVREGGSSKLILDKIKETGQNKIHIMIDPFGNVDYRHWETVVQKLDYTNVMKRKMLKNIYAYCEENNMECIFFPLEDTEFFARYKDGVPIYNEYKTIINTYSLVFFDGPHTTDIVKTEFDFFSSKIPSGGMLVFDDINQYPHMQTLDSYIRDKGFTIVSLGKCKVSYKKN